VTGSFEPASKGGQGCAVAVMVVAALVSVATALGSRVWAERKVHHATAGWVMLPALVYTRDLPRGATITMDCLISQARPEQFHTTSSVKPYDHDKVIGRVLSFAVRKGDPVMWPLFEPEKAK